MDNDRMMVVSPDEYRRREIIKAKQEAAKKRLDQVDDGGRFVVDGVTFKHDADGKAVVVDDANAKAADAEEDRAPVRKGR